MPANAELIQEIFDTSAAGMAFIAPDLRIVKANPAYRALCLDPTIDPVGRRVDEVWPNAGLGDRLAQVLASGEPLGEGEVPFSAVGRTRWYSFHVRRVRWGEGNALFVVLWETTSLVEARWIAETAAEEAMRHAGQLEATFEAVADGMVLFDAVGAVTRMNAAALELARRTGLDPVRLAGEGATRVEIRRPDGTIVPKAEWPVRRALAGEAVRGLHARVSPPSGAAIWLLLSAAPVLGPSGGVAGAVLVLSDETAMHELEEARDDLVRMVSHDLRTPLNVVYTQAHLLQRGNEPPEKVRDRARSIERSCQRMGSMIQDLVEVTLLEAGQLPLVRAPVDLATYLPELLERLRGTLPVERVELEMEAGRRQAELDPARVERIVVNLLSNALKYSANEVVVRVVAGPLDTVVLSVSDRGVGISREDQARIFDRFYRARGSRRPEGLGLGLYIARLLAEAHGGRVEVESELGQGSTFRLILPAVIRAGEPAPLP